MHRYLYYGIPAHDIAVVGVGVWSSPTGAVLSLERHWLLLLDLDLGLRLLNIARWRAHFARAVGHIAVLVGA
jgi:hypothetical protein